ncbi:MAG: hypothetical protein Q9213_000407 [Squamulea squamosa]
MKQLSHDIQEEGKARDELTAGLEIHNGIPVPRNMPRPQQDGYRTPTIHDYEWEKQDVQAPNEKTVATPPPSAGLFSRHPPLVNLSGFDLKLERLHWRERIRHYTWTFFTMTMATGGIANVLYTGYSTRAVSRDVKPPVCYLTNCTYLIGEIRWSTKSFTVESMTPIWIFPIYPLLIVGPHAAILSKTLGPDVALDIIIGGFTLQGIGFLVALMIYSSYIYRLMTQKLPRASARPGMFVAVGPSGFTVAAVLGMAEALSRVVPQDFMGNGPMAAMILKVVASWACLWIWGLAMWFFFVSVGAHWTCARQEGHLAFGMTWFSFIFPNTALITATFAIGKAFGSKAVQVVGCVMTVILLVAWFLVFGMMIRAIAQKQILWPQKGEDKDEGGFKAPEKSERRHTLSKLTSNALSSIRSNDR